MSIRYLSEIPSDTELQENKHSLVMKDSPYWSNAVEVILSAKKRNQRWKNPNRTGDLHGSHYKNPRKYLEAQMRVYASERDEYRSFREALNAALKAFHEERKAHFQNIHLHFERKKRWLREFSERIYALKERIPKSKYGEQVLADFEKDFSVFSLQVLFSQIYHILYKPAHIAQTDKEDIRSLCEHFFSLVEGLEHTAPAEAVRFKTTLPKIKRKLEYTEDRHLAWLDSGNGPFTIALMLDSEEDSYKTYLQFHSSAFLEGDVQNILDAMEKAAIFWQKYGVPELQDLASQKAFIYKILQGKTHYAATKTVQGEYTSMQSIYDTLMRTFADDADFCSKIAALKAACTLDRVYEDTLKDLNRRLAHPLYSTTVISLGNDENIWDILREKRSKMPQMPQDGEFPEEVESFKILDELEREWKFLTSSSHVAVYQHNITHARDLFDRVQKLPFSHKRLRALAREYAERLLRTLKARLLRMIALAPKDSLPEVQISDTLAMIQQFQKAFPQDTTFITVLNTKARTFLYPAYFGAIEKGIERGIYFIDRELSARNEISIYAVSGLTNSLERTEKVLSWVPGYPRLLKQLREKVEIVARKVELLRSRSVESKL